MKRIFFIAITLIPYVTVMANDTTTQSLDAIHKFISLTNIKAVISASFRNGLKPLPHPISENNIRTIVFQSAIGAPLNPLLQFNNFSQMFIVANAPNLKTPGTAFLEYDRKRLTTKGIIINDSWLGPGLLSPKSIPQENINSGLEKIKQTFPNLGVSPYLAIFSIYRDIQTFDIIYDYTVKSSDRSCDDYLYDTKTKIVSFGMGGTSCHFNIPSNSN